MVMKVKLYVHKDKSPYILIKSKDEEILYNDKNSDDTFKTYKYLKEYIKE